MEAQRECGVRRAFFFHSSFACGVCGMGDGAARCRVGLFFSRHRLLLLEGEFQCPSTIPKMVGGRAGLLCSVTSGQSNSDDAARRTSDPRCFSVTSVRRRPANLVDPTFLGSFAGKTPVRIARYSVCDRCFLGSAACIRDEVIGKLRLRIASRSSAFRRQFLFLENDPAG